MSNVNLTRLLQRMVTARKPGFLHPAVLILVFSCTPCCVPLKAGFSLYTSADKVSAGLTGSYYNGQQRSSLTPSNWPASSAPAGIRVDAGLNFEASNWGGRSALGLTGGSDADWNDFSVQWDGWLDITANTRMYLSSDDGSRMWIDRNGDGSFASTPDEFINNGYGFGQAETPSDYTAILTTGLYRIRVQYEELSGGNILKLLHFNGVLNYTDFYGRIHARYVWEGRHVALLTATNTLDPVIIARMLDEIDRAWDFYAWATGRLPIPYGPTRFNGKATIAEVPSTCGAGCGYLGFTGIEIDDEYFAQIYGGLLSGGVHDQTVFYELGRNFWLYEEKLAYKAPDDAGSVVTGFAVLMRFLSMAAADVAGAPFRTWPFPDFRSTVEALIDSYERQPAHNFTNTFKVGQGIADSGLGATDLFASLVLRLFRDYGGTNFIRQLWQQVELRPDAATTQQAVDNFIAAASYAANVNLINQFEAAWKFPVSPVLRTELANALGESIPWPQPAETLIPTGSVWRFNDQNVSLPANWMTDAYVDDGWPQGRGVLGFGDNPATSIHGGLTGSRTPTIYFRSSFVITNLTGYDTVLGRTIRDDGVIVYLNGFEVFRDNITTGFVGHASWASSGVSGTDESRRYAFNVPAGVLKAGSNLVAVEVHQDSRFSDDLSFDLELVAKSAVRPRLEADFDDPSWNLNWPEWAGNYRPWQSTNLIHWFSYTGTSVRTDGKWRTGSSTITSAQFFRLKRD